MEWAKRSIFCITALGLLSGLPVCLAETNTVYTCPSNISTWLTQHSVRSGEQIEIRLHDGTTLKGILRDYALAQMSVELKMVRRRFGEKKIDYLDISRFSLKIGKSNRGLAILGVVVGFQLGTLPGMAIALNDYGTNHTEKLGAGLALSGAILGARWGSKLGARQKITVEVRP